MKRAARLISILLLWQVATAAPIWAQSGGWVPLALLQTSTFIGRPSLAPDSNGTLHLVWSARPPDSDGDAYQVIFYSCWDGHGWLEPVNVLVDPGGKDAVLPQAVVDTAGVLHVLWIGSGILYHSAAPVSLANDPHTWSRPQQVGTQYGVVASVTGLIVTNDGAIHAAFAEVGDEVYHIVSLDGGLSWSAPTTVSASPARQITHVAAIAAAADGTLYIVWGQVPDPEGYPPRGVYFASSNDGGVSWSASVQLAEPEYGEPTILVGNDGRIHVVYNGRVGIGGKYYRESTNGGASWSGITSLVPAGPGMGLNGPPDLVADVQGRLYFIGGGDHFWFAERTAHSWSEVQDMTQALSSLAPAALGYTENPAISILNGDQLHIVFYDVYDVAGEEQIVRLWHTWRELAVPAIPPRPYPVTPPPATAVTSQPTVAPVTARPYPSSSDLPSNSSSGTMPMILGIGASAFLVAGVFLFRRLRRS